MHRTRWECADTETNACALESGVGPRHPGPRLEQIECHAARCATFSTAMRSMESDSRIGLGCKPDDAPRKKDKRQRTGLQVLAPFIGAALAAPFTALARAERRSFGCFTLLGVRRSIGLPIPLQDLQCNPLQLVYEGFHCAWRAVLPRMPLSGPLV